MLTIAGVGITTLSHITEETKAALKNAEHVLYLVNEPVLKQWISKNTRSSEDLDTYYFSHDDRKLSYQKITAHIIERAKQHKSLCVALYGHPCVFAKPALDAAQTLSSQGYPTQILPGISFLDCLFADLRVDPGSSGCQTYEATDFILYDRQFDNRSHLILSQVGMIGNLTHQLNPDKQKIFLGLLYEKLKKNYTDEHELIKYEATQYPMLQPNIARLRLSELPRTDFNRICTLYIPPVIEDRNKMDEDILNLLIRN